VRGSVAKGASCRDAWAAEAGKKSLDKAGLAEQTYGYRDTVWKHSMASSTPAKTLGAVQDYYARTRAMPSFGALAKLVGHSVSTVADAVGVLKAEGFLRASETGRLQPGGRFFERQLAGRVQAGLPAPATDADAEGMLIDEYLVDSPTETFLLSIRGESMRDAGLLPGDVVVVRRGAQTGRGDIVVAMLHGEMTVKELAQRSDGRAYLKARNPDFADIELAEESTLIGLVVGQFRRYVPARAPALKSVK
jgi:SOS-response transcriptional repressor LexA